MEYIIEIIAGKDITHTVKVERDGTPSKLKVSTSAYEFATKFKVKERALKIAKGIPDSRVVPFFGGLVYSTKSSVAPKSRDNNKHSAYRSM